MSKVSNERARAALKAMGLDDETIDAILANQDETEKAVGLPIKNKQRPAVVIQPATVKQPDRPKTIWQLTLTDPTAAWNRAGREFLAHFAQGSNNDGKR